MGVFLHIDWPKRKAPLSGMVLTLDTKIEGTSKPQWPEAVASGAQRGHYYRAFAYPW